MEAIKIGLTSGIHNVFVLSTIIICAAFVAIFFLKEIPLLDRKNEVEEMLEDAEGEMVSRVVID
jgi:hypothetical protein